MLKTFQITLSLNENTERQITYLMENTSENNRSAIIRRAIGLYHSQVQEEQGA